MTEKAVEGKYDLHIDACIKGAQDIRKILNIDDNQYNWLHHKAIKASRQYYIYGVMSELEKTGSSLMRIQDFVGESDVEVTDRLTRNIIEAVLEEQLLWIRKLTEILTELILFVQINEDAYFRHYMLVKELKSLNDTIENTKLAYGCSVQNYEMQQHDLVREIQALEESSINIDKCWYLATDHKKRVPGHKAKFSSFSDRINLAFQSAEPDQIIALGKSYEEGYGGHSSAMHFSAINPRIHDISMEAIQIKAGGMGILAANIIRQSRHLLKDRRRKGYAAVISKAFSEGTNARKLVEAHTKPNIHVGDFVNAQGDLAEVTKVLKGRYGFRSFRLKYLLEQDTRAAGKGSKKTVWTHQNPLFEELPASWMRKIYDRKEVLEQLRAEILAFDPKAKVDTKTLTPHLRETVVHLWKNVGLKESVHGDRAAALIKIQEEVDRLNDKPQKAAK